jgi:hypothetical protein
MSDQLQINIGADTKGLETGLQKAVSAIDNFDKEVQSSAKDLQKFSQYLPNIAVPPNTFKAAEDGLKGLGSAVNAAGDKLKNLPSTTDKAKIALGNLGRVASDLPFGFIAIANNLDPLIQSIGQLDASAKGKLGPTLKALGSALAGPAGIALAFSALSSAITFAVQKYGTLGNAINAIFGRQDALVKQTQDAAKSYEKFNQQLRTTEEIQGAAAGSTAGEAAKVQALAKIVQDQTKTYSERNTALKELQSINKTYFGDIDLEKGKLDKLTTSVEAYTKATIQSAITKAFESEIGATTVELDKQQRVLDKLIPKLGAAAAAQNKQSQALPGLAQAAQQAQVGSAAVEATNAYIEQNKVVQELVTRLKDLNSGINTSIDRYNKIVAPQQAAAEAARLKAEQDKKEADAVKKKTEAITKENAARAQNLKLLLEQAGKLQTVETDKSFPALSKGILDSLQTPLKTFEDALKTSNGRIGRDFTIIPSESVQKAIDQATKIKDEFNKTVDSITNAFNATLGPAIDSVFSAIESGENVIQSIGQAFKRLISDLIKTTIKAAALAAIISAVTGTPFAANFKLVSGFGGAGGAGGLNIGRAAAPSFGGVGGFGGGLQLAGQVVFTQRGSDLVGVLNTQNARINRVG